MSTSQVPLNDSSTVRLSLKPLIEEALAHAKASSDADAAAKLCGAIPLLTRNEDGEELEEPIWVGQLAEYGIEESEPSLTPQQEAAIARFTAKPSNGATPSVPKQASDAPVESKPRLTPEEVRARFPEIACQFVRQQIISAGIPKAQAIEILKKEAAKNGIDLSDDDAERHYDAAWRQRQREPIEGYFVDDSGHLKRRKRKGDKEIIQWLANFHLKSMRRVVRDDGTGAQKFLVIEAQLGEQVFREEMSVDEFQGMQWPIKVIGTNATMAPRNIPEVRHGLQLHAQHEADKLIYTHTGWRSVDGKPHYLHAGGAIVAEGARSDIKATLPTSKMSAFTLPDPPTGEDEKAAIRASLRLLDVADDLFSVPLYAAIWRAPLGDSAMTVFASGSTGLFKTATFKLAQQHYGKDFEDEQNILHFDNGTALGFKESLFVAKDALCLIDEFVPSGSTNEQQRTHAMGEQVIRAVGNKAGRIKFGRDQKLQDPHEPRALLLSTGEDRPRGHSLAARTIHLSVTQETVIKERLTACQDDARMGLYEQAMAGYLRWLAQQSGVGNRRKKRTEELRGFLVSPGRHAKSAQTLADLAVGFEYFLAYVVGVGTITSETANELWSRLWRTFFRLALDQDKIQSTQDPVREVLLRLKSAAESRKIFLLDIGPMADTPENQKEGLPHGAMDIGCKNTDEKGEVIEWLCDPDELYSAIVKLYGEQKATLPWDKSTLWERLAQRHYTKTNENRPTYKTSGSRNRRRVICIPATTFSRIETETDEPQNETAPDVAIPPRSLAG